MGVCCFLGFVNCSNSDLKGNLLSFCRAEGRLLLLEISRFFCSAGFCSLFMYGFIGCVVKLAIVG